MLKLLPPEIADRLGRAFANPQLGLTFVAVAAGVLGGGAAIVFRELIDLIQSGFFGFRGELFHSQARELSWWHILLAPTLGGLLVALIVRYLLPDRRPEGVADVMEASALKGGRMNFRSSLGAALVSAVTVGAGGSAGREGPVVHFAATLVSRLGEFLKYGPNRGQTLLGCGVAAGVAASFNAPIAGTFFALEVVIGSYAIGNVAPVVVAAVTGTIISRTYFGDYPAFIIPTGEINSFLEFPAFAILGVVSAFVAVTLVWSIDVVRKAHIQFKVPPLAQPVMAGFAVGVIGLLFPEAMGVGYEATDQALREELVWSMLILLIVAKTAATALTLGSGFGGGIFSPSLFLGAMLGGAFGLVATHFFPHLSSGHGAYTLVGMGAVAGATLGAPLSTIFMVYEMTQDSPLTIAVMIATVISTQIMSQTFGRSFFHWQLEQRGLNLRDSRETRKMRETIVRQVMQQDYVSVQPGANLEEVREKLTQTTYSEVFVIDEEGYLVGTITLVDLAEDAFHHDHDDEYRAIDVCRRDPPTAAQDDDLEDAMSLLEEAAEEHIAVVDDQTRMQLVGVLHEHDVLTAYHHAVLETRKDDGL